MPRSKATLVKVVVPHLVVWPDVDGRVKPYVDRLQALEERIAKLEQALDTTIRRMAAIQAEVDTRSAKRS